MSRLLKYSIVLALAVVIGSYIVLGPLSLEDIFPGQPEREASAADPSPSPRIPPASPATINEELDYMVAKRLGSLAGWRAFLQAHANGAYAESAGAEIQRRIGGGNASVQASAAPQLLAPPNNQHDYGLSERLASLASYAQSATTKVKQLLLENKDGVPSTPEVSTSSPSDARAASVSTFPAVVPSAGGAVPVTTEAVVGSEALLDAKQEDKPAHSAAPAVPANVRDGTEQFAALSTDQICQDDENRLARLRSNPSSDEAARFANELACERLRPQILSMMESLAPVPVAAGVSQVAPPEPRPQEDAPRASPAAGADAAALKSDETCKRDEERLARLRSTPSGEEAQRFASELSCEALRPQLQRLMDSLGLVAPAQQSEAASSTAFEGSLAQACASERGTLDRLRREPSAGAAELFSRALKCERLRPQVRLLMESLNVEADSVGSAAAPLAAEGHEAASSETRSPNRPDPSACRREMAELNRIRATLDLSEARRFASAATCEALKPQAARLLESLRE
jgi:hypothetical protein